MFCSSHLPSAFMVQTVTSGLRHWGALTFCYSFSQPETGLHGNHIPVAKASGTWRFCRGTRWAPGPGPGLWKTWSWSSTNGSSLTLRGAVWHLIWFKGLKSRLKQHSEPFKTVPVQTKMHLNTDLDPSGSCWINGHEAGNEFKLDLNFSPFSSL